MLIIVDLRIQPRKLGNDDLIFKIHIVNVSLKSTSRKYFAKAKLLVMLYFQENKAELFRIPWGWNDKDKGMRLGLGSGVRDKCLAVLTVVTLSV